MLQQEESKRKTNRGRRFLACNAYGFWFVRDVDPGRRPFSIILWLETFESYSKCNSAIEWVKERVKLGNNNPTYEDYQKFLNTLQ